MKNFPGKKGHSGKSTLLAVCSNQDDLRQLSDILDDARWTVRYAQSCNEARRSIETDRPAVVACDRALSDGSWKDLYRLTISLIDPPPVVVVSRHADENLWAEVLNLGGYDVLASPFEPSEVSRVLEMASRHGRPMSAL